MSTGRAPASSAGCTRHCRFDGDTRSCPAGTAVEGERRSGRPISSSWPSSKSSDEQFAKIGGADPAPRPRRGARAHGSGRRYTTTLCATTTRISVPACHGHAASRKLRPQPTSHQLSPPGGRGRTCRRGRSRASSGNALRCRRCVRRSSTPNSRSRRCSSSTTGAVELERVETRSERSPQRGRRRRRVHGVVVFANHSPSSRPRAYLHDNEDIRVACRDVRSVPDVRLGGTRARLPTTRGVRVAGRAGRHAVRRRSSLCARPAVTRRLLRRGPRRSPRARQLVALDLSSRKPRSPLPSRGGGCRRIATEAPSPARRRDAEQEGLRR